MSEKWLLVGMTNQELEKYPRPQNTEFVTIDLYPDEYAEGAMSDYPMNATTPEVWKRIKREKGSDYFDAIYLDHGISPWHARSKIKWDDKTQRKAKRYKNEIARYYWKLLKADGKLMSRGHEVKHEGVPVRIVEDPFGREETVYEYRRYGVDNLANNFTKMSIAGKKKTKKKRRKRKPRKQRKRRKGSSRKTRRKPKKKKKRKYRRKKH